MLAERFLWRRSDSEDDSRFRSSGKLGGEFFVFTKA
jgi:hypothetical protein